MKYCIWFCCTLLAGFVAAAQSSVSNYTPVDEGSAVGFTIKNLGFNVRGSLTGLQGSISFNPQELSAAMIDVSVDAGTIDTDNTMRDKHLKSEDYFDVKAYPRIHFVSTSVKASGKEGVYSVTGRLTIKDVTREISFPFRAAPKEDGYWFEGEFKIDRKDYKVGESSTISNSLTVSLKVYARSGKK